MDRNPLLLSLASLLLVALRKESVDRNGFGAKLVHSFLSSLSARRAWIEMPWGAGGAAPRVGRSPQGERG